MHKYTFHLSNFAGRSNTNKGTFYSYGNTAAEALKAGLRELWFEQQERGSSRLLWCDAEGLHDIHSSNDEQNWTLEYRDSSHGERVFQNVSLTKTAENCEPVTLGSIKLPIVQRDDGPAPKGSVAWLYAALKEAKGAYIELRGREAYLVQPEWQTRTGEPNPLHSLLMTLSTDGQQTEPSSSFISGTLSSSPDEWSEAAQQIWYQCVSLPTEMALRRHYQGANSMRFELKLEPASSA